MDEVPAPPEKPAIPPPDLPKPYTPPPPDLPKPESSSTPPPLNPGAGPVKVTIREAEDAEESRSIGGNAPFNSRVIAVVIDVIVAFGLTLTAAMLLPFLAPLVWVLGVAYLIVRDSLPFLGGQSIGKKAMTLKVVTLEGGSISGNWQIAIIRNLILVIPPLAFVELFVLLNREDKPGRGIRLGDEWAKTKVIIAEKTATPPDDAA